MASFGERNPNTMDIDLISTEEIIRKINEEDQKVALRVALEKENIAKAVDRIVEGLKNGGRLFYIGSGTSGKLGILDASECPPTFGVEDSLVQGIISGGAEAFGGWLEHTEDDEDLAVHDLQAKKITKKDVIVGITASGNTPYVSKAIAYAKEVGAATIGLICNPEGILKSMCDVCICVDVGPEVIMGSTRLKAGTAQKMVLNMLSTASMIKLGKVYSNLMINLKPINSKLKKRVEAIVQIATDEDESTIKRVLDTCDYDPRIAILILKKNININTAKDTLKKTNGILNQAHFFEPK